MTKTKLARQVKSGTAAKTGPVQAACEIQTGRSPRTVAPAPGFDDSRHHEDDWLATTRERRLAPPRDDA
jgi:hypothetical protein